MMKRIFLLFVACMFLCPAAAMADLNDGLVAYYPFNGNANDESGNGNNGTVHGATLTADRFGNADSAYSFDGNDYIEFTDFYVPESFSISLWAAPSTNNDNQSIIAKHDSSGENIFVFGIFDFNNSSGTLGDYHVRIRNDLYDNDVIFETGLQHFVILIERLSSSQSEVTLYRNGQMLFQHVYNDVIGDTTGNAWVIGQEWDPGNVLSDFFYGTIDDIRIYDRILTNSEIQELYDVTVFGGVVFPGNVESFADTVVDFQVGTGVTPPHDTPSRALGPPDYTSENNEDAFVSIGEEGVLTLQFTDNFLTTSGDDTKDLWIFEIGPAIEPTSVAISTNGYDWIEVGETTGATYGIDIDSFLGSGVILGEKYYFVRLTDLLPAQSGPGYGGADIDAVGAISSVTSNFRISFPLQDYSSQTAPISSVFDHSMSGPYADDDTVVAYTGERGESQYGSDFVLETHFGFRQDADGTPFRVNGNYTGGGDATFLYYDGHPGIDYPVPNGTPVYAAADGIAHIPTSFPGVSTAQTYNTVEVDHQNGYKTYYLHLSSQNVTEGEQVYKGQTIIGYSGDVGSPGAFHLHFEIQYNGVPVDPYGWQGEGVDPYTAAVNINLWGTTQYVNEQIRPEQYIDPSIDGTGKKAVVITHGYMSNVEAWAINDTDENGIADKICKDLDPSATLVKSGWYADIMWLRCRTSEWDVYVYDWRTKAKKLTPIGAYGEAFDLGIHLAEQLAGKHYEHVHMLAHSAGSNLINMASEHLKKLAPSTEIHLTFFDAYDPMAQLKCGGQLSAYGKSADFADNYVDIRTLDTLFIGDLDGTKLFLPNAFNVDVTKWDKREEPLPPAAALFRHEWPYIFYNEWTFMPMTYDMGYQITLEDGNYKPTNREVGKACILSSEGINGQPVCESLQTVCDLAQPGEDIRTIGDPDVVIGQITESVTGVADIINDPSGLLEYWFLETGSPVWSNISLTLMKPVNSLKFDYEFLSDAGAEGYLTVYFDGEIVGHIDERYVDAGKQVSPTFALGNIEPGAHSLAFRVDPFTAVKSSVKLSNVKLINVNTAPVFPWHMFLPAIQAGAK